MTIKNYKVTLKHDYGKINIRTAATSIEAAIHQIMKYANCPQSSIIKIKEIL